MIVQSVLDQLLKKYNRFLDLPPSEEVEKIKEEIKRNFKDKKVLLPALKLTGDNSIMIGLAAYLKYKAKKQKTIKPEKIKADGSLKL